MAFDKHDPAKPVRVRVFSPLGYYPKHSISVPDAWLLVRDDLIVSAVQTASSEAHSFGEEHFSDLEFLALEETRFLGGIAVSLHPDDGMVYTYPLRDHVDVAFGLHDDEIFEAARLHADRYSERGWLNAGAVLPPAQRGPAYRWRDAGVDRDRVLDVVGASKLDDHLMIRGLGALLRADMCWQHYEIAESAVIQLYVALDASFEIVLEVLRGRGVSNPSASDAGALIDEVFNPGIDSGSYFEDYYEGRIKTMHPSSRFGVFAVAPLQADDYYDLRRALVEVYHWLITGRTVQPRSWNSSGA